jgi:tRNA pseudouridine55 synthase
LKKARDVLNGVLVLDKPTNMSSASAVHHVRHRLRVKRAGHGGTLDPIATGVLPICIGEATKLAQYLLADDKAYEAELLLGVEMDTLDRTGVVVTTRPTEHVTREAVLRVLAAHMGEHDQMPPMYSAIKIDGRRLYHAARLGEEIERTARKIRIDQLELLELDGPRMRIAIACSKGTYVRSLIADIGNDLGCGAHMTELRRTRCGTFTIGMAHDLDRLDNFRLVSMLDATTLPRITLSPEHVPKVRSGLQLPPGTLGAGPEMYERFMMVAPDGTLIAVGHVEADKTLYDRVFVF